MSVPAKSEKTDGKKGEDGRTYHVGTKSGETANKILTVGDPARAELVAKHLDADVPVNKILSKRGYLTITGAYKGVPVSIVAIGMGMSMMDFFVREVRAVVEGPMQIIRFGSCGSISDAVKVGTMCVADEGSVSVTRNFDYFTGSDAATPYLISQPVKADAELSNNLLQQLRAAVGADKVSHGLNVTADSFYCSQARKDIRFPDANNELLQTVTTKYPNAVTLEMESFMLLHLAACSGRQTAQIGGRIEADLRIRAAATTMIFAGRLGGEFINPEQVEELEVGAGKACLEALIATN
ncbi:nucleoside phosphorylase domain-containing protein [Chytriomyces sp. MP71]|nr:nucleoside phosphorylase domain-containing protein [Chytriomyces sp. MP71]